MPEIKVSPPVTITSINVYRGWNEANPDVGRISYMPVLVLAVGDPVPLDTPPNTVILRVVEI